MKLGPFVNELSFPLSWTCYKSLSRKKQDKEKKRERLVILGMLINIHEQSNLASIFKYDEVVVNCFIEA